MKSVKMNVYSEPEKWDRNIDFHDVITFVINILKGLLFPYILFSCDKNYHSRSDKFSSARINKISKTLI